MPTIHTHPAQPPEKPTQGPSAASAATQVTQAKEAAKAQEACPPVQGKTVEAAKPAKPAGDSNQVKQGAQGKAQANLSFEDIGKQLEASKARVDAIDKAKQKADSTFKAKIEPLEAEIAKNRAERDELSKQLEALTGKADTTKAAEPDIELEIIDKIKDPKVKMELLTDRIERLSKAHEQNRQELQQIELKLGEVQEFKPDKKAKKPE